MSEKFDIPLLQNQKRPDDTRMHSQAAMSNRMPRPRGLRFSGTPFQDISADAKCLVILDVRTPQEYGSSHLNASINLDFRSPSFRDEIAMLDRNNAYLLYCRTGIRSARVLRLMRSLGF